MEMEMEGKSNGGSKVAKEVASGCLKPVEDPSLLQALALMEGNSCSKGSETKEGGDNRQEGEGVIVKKQHVAMAMGMEVLDCPVCSTPLSPPIFQCALGHFVCSNCRDKLVGTKANKVCSVCSRAVSTRCHGMERVVDSIVVPCSYAVHGCADTTTYHKKRAHNEVCPHAPCFCPEKGCGFAGMTAVLLDHFTAQHEWPTTRFQYYKPFNIPVKTGMHVLRGGEDGHPFLLHVASLDSTPLHGVSLVCIGQQHAALESKFGCSVGFSWFKGHYQASTLDTIRSTSLSDGLPTDYFLTVPEACIGGGARVMLSVTIDTETVYGDDDELEEEEDDDDSYIEEDEDEDSDENKDDETSNEDDESYNEEEDADSVEDEDDETSNEDDESWEEVSCNDYY